VFRILEQHDETTDDNDVAVTQRTLVGIVPVDECPVAGTKVADRPATVAVLNHAMVPADRARFEDDRVVRRPPDRDRLIVDRAVIDHPGLSDFQLGHEGDSNPSGNTMGDLPFHPAAGPMSTDDREFAPPNGTL
jgi:hypothetical protein